MNILRQSYACFARNVARLLPSRPSTWYKINTRPISNLAKYSNLAMKAKVAYPKKKNFMSDFIMPDTSHLLKAIEHGQFFMVTGPIGSGKTTTCQFTYLFELRDYSPIWVTLHDISPSDFWKKVGDQMKKVPFYESNEPDIEDYVTFLDFFRRHKEKKIVIFFDDFETLQSYPEVSEQFLKTLSTTRNRPHIFGLHAVVAIGTESIRNCSGNKLPFTSLASWEIEFLTQKQVNTLFEGMGLEESMLDYLFRKTNGYPELVTFCWQRIREKMNLPTYTPEKLRKFVYTDLVGEIANKFADLIDILSSSPKFMACIIDHLSLEAGSYRSYRSADATQMELVGILLKIENYNIGMPAPFIRDILIRKYLNTDWEFLPLNGLSIDVPRLLRLAIPRFDKVAMTNKLSFKHNKADKKDFSANKESKAPNEFTYRFQFSVQLAILKLLWFAVGDEQAAPAIDRNTCKADHVIWNKKTDEKTVLEIVAHESDYTSSNSVSEHITRCRNSYLRIPGVTRAYVINFTVNKPGNEGYVWQKDTLAKREQEDPRLFVIHIWHDITWENVIMYEGPGEGVRLLPQKLT